MKKVSIIVPIYNREKDLMKILLQWMKLILIGTSDRFFSSFYFGLPYSPPISICVF